jgi:DNA mismatch endonuclease (patch repair protein)
MRFRVAPKQLPGKPDIVFTRAKLAVFVDGCWWHLCPVHGSIPKNNADWWRAKLHRNVERDRQKDEMLRAAGWSVLHVWEHEKVAEAADAVETARKQALHSLGRASG